MESDKIKEIDYLASSDILNVSMSKLKKKYYDPELDKINTDNRKGKQHEKDTVFISLPAFVLCFVRLHTRALDHAKRG